MQELRHLSKASSSIFCYELNNRHGTVMLEAPREKMKNQAQNKFTCEFLSLSCFNHYVIYCILSGQICAAFYVPLCLCDDVSLYICTLCLSMSTTITQASQHVCRHAHQHENSKAHGHLLSTRLEVFMLTKNVLVSLRNTSI